MKQRIYLDNNASTKVDARILPFINQELEELPGNPSSIHFHGRRSKEKLHSYRSIVASYLKAKPEEIIFCSGGTEAANLLLYGAFQDKFQGHLISSELEHSCVYQSILDLESKGCSVTFLKTGLSGAVNPEDVQKAIRSDTKLISLMAVNNETGVITDIESIAAIAKKAEIPFIVDGVALLGKELFTIPEGVTAMFFSGHKIHAPKGIGFIFSRRWFKWPSIIRGGFQEFNHRAGTENMPGIAGLAKALEILQESQNETIEKMRQLRNQLEDGLKSHLEGVEINGESARVSNTSNLSFKGIDGESLLINLDLDGISVSHGSACSSGTLEPSRILLKMGIPLARARTAIRFSVSRDTTSSEIEKCIEVITKNVRKLTLK